MAISLHIFLLNNKLNIISINCVGTLLGRHTVTIEPTRKQEFFISTDDPVNG